MDTGEADLLQASDVGQLTYPLSSANAPEYRTPDPDGDLESELVAKSVIQGEGTAKVRPFQLVKFTIYETKSCIYVVGSNARESRFRMLEIDITVPPTELELRETLPPCTRSEIMEVLATLEKTSKAAGGLAKRLTACGIVGFIRFTEGYYMCVITKRSAVALIGGHYIYHIDGTELIPVAHSSTFKQPDRRSQEGRLLSTFLNLDLSRTFYISYTYDITHTLQHNLTAEKLRAMALQPPDDLAGYNEMFVWNHSLLQPALSNFEATMDWCLPIIHGFIDQAKISVSGRTVLVAIIARRSHYFAGARFLKRGANDQGRVANEVETEQIVTDLLTTSFHDSRDGIFNSPRYTSYVQHRGSIPLFWSQDVSNMSPKPPIELNAVDPFYSAAGLHFSDLFQRYGNPVLVLNLIKQKEKVPRESKLLKEYTACVDYLNQFLPKQNKIRYTAWDMSRASKGRNQEVIKFLERYADETLQTTGFFHNGKNLSGMRIQDGICRTNCIDCLDRTNAAQFVIGKRALGYQLQALGIIDSPNIEYDSDAVNLLTEMFHDHGDTIALQYGGSHLVNTMETYRKINQWSSHSRDMIESIRRFYSNSFVDSQRQDAINIFLGNYVWEKGQPLLWDLPTDFYLHNSLARKYRRSYIYWWVGDNLKSEHDRIQDQLVKVPVEDQEPLVAYPGFVDNYWNEFYRPRLLTSFHIAFAFNVNSTLRYIPSGRTKYELQYISPFQSRKQERREEGTKRQPTERAVSASSIRREALRRATGLYRKPSFQRLIGEKLTNRLLAENDVVVDHDSSDLSSIRALQEKLSGFLSPPEALTPNVSEEKEYEQLLDQASFDSDYEVYRAAVSADDIMTSLSISDNDYRQYQEHHDLSRLELPSIPVDDTNSNYDYYQEWLSY